MTTDDVSEVLQKFKDAITPEMETPKMRGKGADLFARRRQRMEKFIITDEKRNEKLDRASTNGFVPENTVDPPKLDSLPATPTTPIFPQTHPFYQPLPISSTLSGYCTDMEDDRPSFHRNMKVNYFSDCEDTGDFTYETKGRRNRPVNRRAWETDVEDAYLSEVETPVRPSYKLTNTIYAPAMQKTDPSGWTSASQTPYSPSSTSQHNIMPRSFATLSVPKRAWSRVSFCPKKPSPQRTRSHPTIQYPGARPNLPTGIQLNAAKPTIDHAIANKGKNAIKPMNRPKTLPVNQILPKIDERQIHDNKISSNHQSTVNQDNILQPTIGTNSTPTSSHKSSATITIMSRKNTSGQQERRRALKTGDKLVPDSSREDIRPESPYDNDEIKRPTSSASVASCVSSNSSAFTSTITSRCLTPTNRPRTPTGVPKVLKIAGTKPISPNPAESSPTPFNTPTPLEQRDMKAHLEEQSNTSEPNKSTADKKVSACLKVLDPTRSLSLPKSIPYHSSPSPTLNAVLKQETIGNWTNQTGAGNQMETLNNWTDTAIAHRNPFPKPQSPVPNRTPQALGSIAEGMKGKGARMFEKQQRRMQNYTKETSKESYPDLAYPNEPNLSTNCNRSSHAATYQTPKDAKIGMRDVVGEFQKCSQPGKVKRPSETRRTVRDPLHYQQQFTYRQPFAEDFIRSPPNTKYMNESKDLPETFQMYPSANDFVQTPPLIPSPNDPRWTFGDDVVSTKSTSSMSSQKSLGPKTAPKPAKALIQRQLSRESVKQCPFPATCEDTSRDDPLPDFEEQTADAMTDHPEIKPDAEAWSASKPAPANQQLRDLNGKINPSESKEVVRDENDLAAINMTQKPVVSKPKFDGRKVGVHFEIWSP